MTVREAADALWPCGHERTLENTRKVGIAGVRCRECRKAIDRKDWAKRGATVNAKRKALRAERSKP